MDAIEELKLGIEVCVLARTVTCRLRVPPRGGLERHRRGRPPPSDAFAMMRAARAVILWGLSRQATVCELRPALPPPSSQATKRAQEARDARTKLRLKIAADPEGFFAHADADGNGSLSFAEWEESCTGFLGAVEPGLVRTLFDEMDLDKDGSVSKDEFLEMRNAIRLFVQDAKCQELLVEALAGLVAARWNTVTDDSVTKDTPVAEKTTVVLTELSADEMREEVTAVLPKRLEERVAQVKLERKRSAEALKELQVDQEGVGKFSQLPIAAYGKKDAFHKGLEVNTEGW